MTPPQPLHLSLPSGRPGQLLAVVLTFLAIAVVAVGIVGPLLDRYAVGAEDLATRRATAQRLETFVADLPLWRDRARAVAASMPADSVLLPGDSDPVAAAGAQASLQAMLSDLGISLASVESLAADDLGVHRRLRLHLAFLASWPTLVQFLERVGAATPILLVDELQLSLARHRIGVVAGTLEVNCTIVAFRSTTSRSGPP